MAGAFPGLPLLAMQASVTPAPLEASHIRLTTQTYTLPIATAVGILAATVSTPPQYGHMNVMSYRLSRPRTTFRCAQMSSTCGGSQG